MAVSADTSGAPDPVLNFHMAPNSPIEVGELTAALGAVSRQYQRFILDEGLSQRMADARLLIPNVSHGSIDINFLPDFHTTVATVRPLMPLMVGKVELIRRFAERLRRVLEFFLKRADAGSISISSKDCDDATNIVNPIARHGGNQVITVVNGDVHNHILKINAEDARTIADNATNTKSLLSVGEPEKRQRVAMVWRQLDSDEAKVEGQRSPDHGIVAEIDPKPRPVFFTDDMSHLKREMIENEENPYQKIFFVDVEVSRIPGGRVGNYRIIGFQLFTAQKGQGAYLNGKRIKVSIVDTLIKSLLATGFPYDRKVSEKNNLDYFHDLLMASQEVRRDGSAALDLCYVAAGRFDGFWELKLKPWDVAAGSLIVCEAGGRVTDLSGNTFDIFADEVLASNGIIHGQMVEILRTAGKRKGR